MKKVLLITNIPNPYRVPLFNVMSKAFAMENYHLKVIFGSEGYKRRLFTLDKSELKFDYRILNDQAHQLSSNEEKTVFLYKGLSSVLKEEKPDIIIVSGFSSASLKVMWYSLKNKIPYIIWSGSIEKENRNSSFIRKIQRKILVNFASSFVAYGTLAKNYLMSIGAKDSQVSIATNTVDTDFYYSETNKIRNSLNETGTPHFLYLGYLVPRKNVNLLLAAILQLSNKRRDFILDIVGDGSDKEELETFVENQKIDDLVKFHGFKQKSELPKFLGSSRAMLFQTDFDIWGLVLNEAMASGIPCLASKNAGATSDLVVENETGFAINYENIAEVVEKIEFFIDNREKAAQMGQRAADFIRTNVNLETAANGFLKAVKIASGNN